MTFEPHTIKAVAALLLGEPNAALSTSKQLRYGTHGSLAIDLDKNTFFDHESNEGGGILDLIQRQTSLKTRKEAAQWLKNCGLASQEIATNASPKLAVAMSQKSQVPDLEEKAVEKTAQKAEPTDENLQLQSPASPNVLASPGLNAKNHDYRDEFGELLFQVKRYYKGKDKCFSQRQPDGRGGWIDNTKGVRQVPYRLPELLAVQSQLTKPVYVVEGEKDADRLASLGLIATCNAGGAGKWKPCHSEHFKGRVVVCIPDNDKAGREHVQKVVKSLKGIAAHIRILELPGLPEKGDVSDWLDAGNTLEQMLALPTMPTSEAKPAGKLDGDDGEEKTSQAKMLVEFATQKFEMLHDKNGDVYARDLHTSEVRRLGGRQFKDRIIAGFYEKTKSAVRDQSLKEALGTLNALGRFNGTPQAVHVRCAAHGGKYYLDLCEGGNSRAIELGAGQWRVVDSPPVLFVRGEAMQPLPVPVKGGNLSKLWDIANIPENLRILVVTWLIDSLRTDTPFPGLELIGEQGSGKSTAAEALRRVIDPNSCNLRGAPKTVEDIFVAAGHSHVVAYENVSHLPGAMQDALCILSTGGGFAKRQLYSNDEEHVINVRRPWLINGIAIAVTQQDLVDRVISIECPVIESRQPSSGQWQQFGKDLPGILGGLLDTAAKALALLPEMKLPAGDRPRLLEYALLGMAVAHSANKPASEFMDKFRELRAETVARTVDNSPVASALIELLEKEGVDIHDAVKGILSRLERYKPLGAEAWPRTPKGLGDALRRAAPALRTMGIECKSLGNTGGVVKWSIKRKLPTASHASHASHGGGDFDDQEIKAGMTCMTSMTSEPQVLVKENQIIEVDL